MVVEEKDNININMLKKDKIQIFKVVNENPREYLSVSHFIRLAIWEKLKKHGVDNGI